MKKSAGRTNSGPPLYFSLVWLVYLSFPLYSIFQLPFGEMMLGLLLLTIFVFLYVCAFRPTRYRFHAVVLMLVLIGISCYKFGENFIFLGFYPSPVMGLFKDKRQIQTGMGLFILLFGLVIWHYHLYDSVYNVFQYFPPLIVMLLMPLGMRLTQRSRELKDRLVLANEEIARLSKNEERQRISRDLHDTLGHTLSLITLKSELAEKLIAQQPERAAREVRDIQMTSRAALKQVRALVSEMSMASIRDEAVNARQILAAADIQLQLAGNFEDVSAPPLVDNILGMCLREAITNVVKHSGAKTCTLRLHEKPGHIVLTVADNGRGVAESTDSESRPTPGSGLRGLKDRLRLVEGELDFLSETGKGTQITFNVPLPDKSTVEETVKA